MTFRQQSVELARAAECAVAGEHLESLELPEVMSVIEILRWR
jgi:hypothetical protein